MRLYALCDQDMLDKKNISMETYIQIAKKYSSEIIQYRNKTSDIATIKKQLIKMRKLFDGYIIINDRYELVEFCDGVHLGQEDLLGIDKDKKIAVDTLRKVVGSDKIIGLSTHNEAEILEANNFDINYIGLGAYRATTTKSDIKDILGDKADEIAKKSKHPVAVIGGVQLQDSFENITYHVIGSGLLVFV
jgi:thiamine-phosphate pyrophosphorylase